MTDNGMQNRRTLAKQTDINIVEQLAQAFVSFVVLLQINRTNMAEAVEKKKKIWAERLHSEPGGK